MQTQEGGNPKLKPIAKGGGGGVQKHPMAPPPEINPVLKHTKTMHTTLSISCPCPCALLHASVDY